MIFGRNIKSWCTLEVCYENALYKFTFDIDIDIDIGAFVLDTASFALF